VSRLAGTFPQTHGRAIEIFDAPIGWCAGCLMRGRVDWGIALCPVRRAMSHEGQRACRVGL